MTDNGRYLQGFGLSLLIHAALAGIVLWLWKGSSTKPAPQSVRWEVNIRNPSPPDPPPESRRLPKPPEPAPLPPVESSPQPALGAITPAAPANPGSRPGTAAPMVDIPRPLLSSGGGAAIIAVPTTSGWPVGLATAGDGGTSFGRGAAQGATGFSSSLAPIVRIPPTYPLEARRQKLEGWVKLEFTVLEDGSVAEIKVKSAQPSGVFEPAALAAIAQWKFSPALENGKAIRRRARQTLNFELQN